MLTAAMLGQVVGLYAAVDNKSVSVDLVHHRLLTETTKMTSFLTTKTVPWQSWHSALHLEHPELVLFLLVAKCNWPLKAFPLPKKLKIQISGGVPLKLQEGIYFAFCFLAPCWKQVSTPAMMLCLRPTVPDGGN